MEKRIVYSPFCTVFLGHAFFLHPAEDITGDWENPATAPNTLTASKQKQLMKDEQVLQRYDIQKHFDIHPDTRTKHLLDACKIKLRQTPGGFDLWIRQAEPGGIIQPVQPLDQRIKFNFYVSLKMPALMNATHGDPGNSQTSIWHFSNRAGNAVEGMNLLNVPGSNGDSRYADIQDRIKRMDQRITLDVSNQNVRTLNIVLRNDLTSRVYFFQKREEEARLGLCSWSPAELASGKYSLSAFDENGKEIPAFKQNIYWNAGDMPRSAWAVIELFHLPEFPPDSYALTNNGSLTAPVYVLWWKNRATYWRYHFDKAQPQPDTNCQLRFGTRADQSADPTCLVSKSPQPLLNRYKKMRFFIANAHGEDAYLLPNPEPQSLYPSASGEYSEIYMGKTDLNKLIHSL